MLLPFSRKKGTGQRGKEGGGEKSTKIASQGGSRQRESLKKRSTFPRDSLITVISIKGEGGEC